MHELLKYIMLNYEDHLNYLNIREIFKTITLNCKY